MKLPNPERAVISQDKLVSYLMNPAHPDNGGKAAFFLSHGFSPDRWQELASALVGLAATINVSKSVASPHGTKYVLDGELRTPSGRSPRVRTVWIVDAGTDAPRLVTAYPQDN
jgi:hypothetical protein